MKFAMFLLMTFLITSPVIAQENNLAITSSAFIYGESIPDRFTCMGVDINPPLKFHNIPDGTESLVLTVDDPDAKPETWDHWVVYNIPPDVTEIKENFIPGFEGLNDFGRYAYGGPCPPDGEHRYFFKLYALDIILDIDEGMTKQDVLNKIKTHTLSQAELVGRYRKPIWGNR